MIRLSNGHQFEYLAASGALAYDGRGWPWEWPLRWLGLIHPEYFTIVTKTLTLKPRKGNLRWSHPWSSVRLIRNGVVNAIGLTNPGIEWWIQKVGPKIAASGYSLVCSITDDDPKTLGEMAARLDPFPLKAIEINASCPNSDQDLIENTQKVLDAVSSVRSKTKHPIFLKLSILHPYSKLAAETEGIVDAISINSIPWKKIFPNQESPLASFGGGGVSGKITQKFSWEMVSELSKASKIPVIGPGVWEYEDLARIRALGAKAISFGSIFMRYPWRPTQFVKRETKAHL